MTASSYVLPASGYVRAAEIGPGMTVHDWHYANPLRVQSVSIISGDRVVVTPTNRYEAIATYHRDELVQVTR
jgi:hypothetical protein